MADTEEQNSGSPWWNILDEITKAIESWWEPAHSIVSRLWRAADGYVRFAIRLIIWSSLIIIGGMLYGDRFISSLIASLPIIGIILLLVRKPIVVGLIAGADEKFIKGACRRALTTIIGVELTVGIYASIIRAANDRKLIPLFLVVIFTLIILAFAKKISFFSFAKAILWIILVAITAIWVAGGREEIKRKAAEETQYTPPTHPAPYPQDYAKKETRRFEYPDGDGIIVKLETNCDKEDFIAVIPPHHQLELHHVYFAETAIANRCSYDVYGNSFPVYGPPDGYETKKELVGDLPDPKIKAHTSLIEFLYPDKRTVYQAVKKNGDVITTENCSNGEIRVYSIYNITKSVLFSRLAQQIGHDGSTVTFEGKITPIKCH